jgi:hypothetical protein
MNMFCPFIYTNGARVAGVMVEETSREFMYRPGRRSGNQAVYYAMDVEAKGDEGTKEL